MRFNEIKKLIKEDQDLFEINMSPTNLKKLAAQTGAMAGMEFEMIVPGADGGDDDPSEQEPDYENYDESVTSIDDAINFFDDGDFNGQREIRRLRDQMGDSYLEWLGDAWSNHFDIYKSTIVFRYAKENLTEEDIAEIMGLDEAEAEALENRGATPEDYMDAAEKIIEDELEPWLERAQEDAQEEYYEDDHEDDWLRSEGLNYMSDVERQYGVMWPHWSSGDSWSSGEGDSIESVADEFKQAIGRKVNWSERYHGGTRTNDAYVVEPDSSLEPDDTNDAGLEFVSPPLPVDDMISDLNKVKAWAKQRGCYTNDSTGLHINVSVPGFDNDKLDYVKLALLLGDEYVLNQFGRTGNTYAKSAMGMIKERIAQRPEDAASMLQKMKTGLGELATKVIHSGTTSKYTSINTKTGYIEFRSPGGDWLNTNFDKIETTLLRFVVALDAAMDPAKYRDEYLKKLYAVLKPKDQNDTLSYFAKFSVGELPKIALKSFIRQAQLERSTKKTAPAAAADNQGNWGIWLSTDNRFSQLPGEYRAGQEIPLRRFPSQAAATQYLDQARVNNPRLRTDAEPREISSNTTTPLPDIFPDIPRQGAAGGEFTGAWRVVDSNTGDELYRFSGVGNNQADANRVAGQWVRSNYISAPIEVYPILSWMS